MEKLSHIESQASAPTRIEIERIGWTQRGARYRVLHLGRVLIASTRDPENDAARALHALGLSGELRTRHKGALFDGQVLDIQMAATRSARESEAHGPRHFKWRAYGRDVEGAA